MHSRLAVLLSMCGLAMATGSLRRSAASAGVGAGASADAHHKKHAYGLSIETNKVDEYSKAVNNGQKLVTCRGEWRRGQRARAAGSGARAAGGESGGRAVQADAPTAVPRRPPPAEPGVNYTATPANCIRCDHQLTPAEKKKIKEESTHVRAPRAAALSRRPCPRPPPLCQPPSRAPRANHPQLVELKKKRDEAAKKDAAKTGKEYTEANKAYEEAKAKAMKAHAKHHSRVKGKCATADVPALKLATPNAALPPGNATWGCAVNVTLDADTNSATNWNHTGRVVVNGHTYAAEFDSSRCGDKHTCKYCTGAKAVGKCKAHKKHPGVYKCAPLCGKKCTQAKLEAEKKAKAAHK